MSRAFRGVRLHMAAMSYHELAFIFVGFDCHCMSPILQACLAISVRCLKCLKCLSTKPSNFGTVTLTPAGGDYVSEHMIDKVR